MVLPRPSLFLPRFTRTLLTAIFTVFDVCLGFLPDYLLCESVLLRSHGVPWRPGTVVRSPFLRGFQGMSLLAGRAGLNGWQWIFLLVRRSTPQEDESCMLIRFSTVRRYNRRCRHHLDLLDRRLPGQGVFPHAGRKGLCHPARRGGSRRLCPGQGHSRQGRLSHARPQGVGLRHVLPLLDHRQLCLCLRAFLFFSCINVRTSPN